MTTTEVSSPWLRRLGDGGATGRLVFFPPAGGNASAAWPLTSAVPAGWSVYGVQYPGRGPRLLDEPSASIRVLAAACVPAIAPDHRRTVLFGHSFGATVAYEVAHLLEADGHPAAGLVVAGSSAPHRRHDWMPEGALDDDALLEFLRGRGGTPADLLANDELMRLALPALRVDLGMAQTYVDDHGGGLATPVAAVGGRRDPAVSEAELRSWSAVTGTWLGDVYSDGDHFFYVQDTELIGAVLRRNWEMS
ncbi:MAG TPA: alpha/beta fold hydrolase [Pseudonocardiaceae bacterium]|nr:alpha/beta fold hydrolase [Pseudonocardiaceae bacterium]